MCWMVSSADFWSNSSFSVSSDKNHFDFMYRLILYFKENNFCFKESSFKVLHCTLKMVSVCSPFPSLVLFFHQKLITALLESVGSREWPQKIFHNQYPWKNVARPDRGSNLRPPDHQSDLHLTEPPRPAAEEILDSLFPHNFTFVCITIIILTFFFISHW